MPIYLAFYSEEYSVEALYLVTNRLVLCAIVIASALCPASTATAQSKFFSTPGRGADGAKQNAQVNTLQGENERMNACTAQGRIYAPTNPNADAEGCLPRFTIHPDHTSIAAGAGANNSLHIHVDGTTNSHSGALRLIKNHSGQTGGGPGVTFFNLDGRLGAIYGTTDGSLGGIQFRAGAGGNQNLMQLDAGGLTVDGRVTANQVYVGSGNIGNIPTCTSAQKLQWSGTAWTCVTDNIGATAATEVDPKVGTLTNGRWCRTNGTQVICDVNVPLNCGTSQKLHWNGSAWTCIADQGIVTESDPKVGTLTNGKWCTASGGQVVCTSDAPSGTTTTTTGGGASCSPGGPGSSNCSWGCFSTVAHMQVVSCSCDCHTISCQCNNGTWNQVGGTCGWCDDNGDW